MLSPFTDCEHLTAFSTLEKTQAGNDSTIVFLMKLYKEHQRLIEQNVLLVSSQSPKNHKRQQVRQKKKKKSDNFKLLILVSE